LQQELARCLVASWPVREKSPMPWRLTSRFWLDARHYQIAALSTLLVFNLGWIDFGARPANSVLALVAALITQIVCARLTGVPIDLRSPLITGLSLSLLLRADEPWIHALAGVVAIGSKFALRLDGKHIWNPAGFAIVILLFTANSHVWISPGSWGSGVWLASLLVFFAILVLGAARRSDIAIFFFGTHAALLFARAAWLGDPFAIPLHQLQSGSLLIFTFFMISDPRTSPDSRLGRFLFAASVALLAHYMAFFMQMRPALYVALIALSPFILLIDRILPAQRFAWTRPVPQGAPR
jgi:Na+-transporting NADH:ubiquinone oxidoreductase subunit NqrB